MEKTLPKHLISVLLLGKFILNTGYGMEQNPHHNQETIIHQIIRSHKMLLPTEEVVAIPSEISKIIFNEIHDDKDIASFWATCRAWKIIGDSYYAKKNTEKRIFPWKECPHLPPRILNRLNTDYRFLLGMHKNIFFYNVEKSDRTRFEITCEHIQNTPLVPKQSLVKSFAEMLQLHLHIIRPTLYQNNIDSAYNSGKEMNQIFNKKIAKVGVKLSTIRNQQDIRFQNEIFFYLYCSSFIKDSRGINSKIRSDPFYQKLKCNLFDVIKNHDQLLSLQQTDNKSDQLWKEQIDLDCAPTCRDYFDAGNAHYIVKKYQEAVDYYKMALKAEQQGRADKPNLNNLYNIAASYHTLKNYHNSAHFYDQFFEQHLLQTKDAKDIYKFELDALKFAANVHKELGNNDKESYYLMRIEEIETAEAICQAEALRKKEEAEAETRRLLSKRAIEEDKAAETLLQERTLKGKKGKKEKKEKIIHNTKK